MGFRFRGSVRILPGVRINFSGSGASFSVGPRGLHYTIGSRGRRVTAGIPGTGLSWTQYAPHSDDRNIVLHQSSSPAPPSLLPSQLSNPGLGPIQSSSAGEINARSTSQLAPILNSVNQRFRISIPIGFTSLLLFTGAVLQANHLWLEISVLYATILIPLAIFLDRYRRSVKVVYEPEGVTARIAEALTVAFSELRACKAVWMVQAEGSTADWKRNAGATSLNQRKATRLHFDRPSCLRGKNRFPAFKLGVDELYLLPDAALAVVNGAIAAVSYRELQFSRDTIKFIEEDRIPSDSPIVDHTWRYVNKSGGPDRRFAANRQLPICAYGQLHFRSDGGLNCKFQFSNPAAAEPLSRVIEALRRITEEMPNSISYIRTANRLPTVVFLSIASLTAVAQLGFLKDGIVRKDPGGNLLGLPASPQMTAPAKPLKNEIPSPTARNGPSPSTRTADPPLQIIPPPVAVDESRSPPSVNAEIPKEPLDLGDAENVRWVQSRLRELGFLRSGSVGWDVASRSALRDFRASNNLGNDDKWDYKAEQLLASGTALRVEQTFIGAWSEEPCDSRAKPDIVVNSRRATSATGGTCEFSNVKLLGSSWTVGTTCTNAGERWSATIRLSVVNGKLTWVGRDGAETQYFRCR